jgi:hypothetical protein
MRQVVNAQQGLPLRYAIHSSFESRTLHMSTTLSAKPRMTGVLTALAIIAGAAVAGTVVLWGYYGTAVFFEMVRAGWAACF